MSDRTLLYLTDDAGAHLQLWRQQGDIAPQRLAEGGWDDGAVVDALRTTAERRDALWVVMPPTWGSLLQVPIPSRRRDQALQALSFAVEDLVVDDIDSLHLTLGNEPDRSGDVPRWPVLVTRADGRQWVLDRLAGLGLRPQGLAHALDLWPRPEPGTWLAFVMAGGTELAVVTGPHAGFVISLGEEARHPSALLAQMLPQMQMGDAPPETIVGHGWAPVDEDRLEAQPGLDVALRSRPAPDWPAMWLSAIAKRQPLSAVEPPNAGNRLRQRRQWLGVAALLALLAVALTAERAIAGWQAAAQSRQLQARITRDFHAALPGVSRLVNARVQLAQALAAANGGGRDDGFLVAMTALGQGLARARAQDRHVVLREVAFRRGHLVADLNGTQYDALQKLLGQLSRQPTLSVKRLDSGVDAGKARMRLDIAVNAGEEGVR